MSILGLAEKATTEKKFITDQIRCGVSVIGVEKGEIKREFKEKDCKGIDIPYVELKSGKTFELMGITKGGKYELRVSKEEYPKSYAKSLPFFVLPPDLETHYGKRATAIKILLFIDQPLEEVIKADNCKFESDKRLGCIGNGGIDKEGNMIPGKARRYSYTKQQYIDFEPCLCAYSRYFQGRIDSIPFSSLEADNLFKKGSFIDTRFPEMNLPAEIFVQGVWRKVKGVTGEGKILFEPLEPQCDVRYRINFLTPESPGLDLTTFEGGGLMSAERLMSQVDTLQKILTDKETGKMKLNSILLEFRIKWETKKEKGKPTKTYSAVYFHFPHSVMKLVQDTNKDIIDTPLISIPEKVDEETGEVLSAEFEDIETPTDLQMENQEQKALEDNEPDPYEGTPFAKEKK